MADESPAATARALAREAARTSGVSLADLRDAADLEAAAGLWGEVWQSAPGSLPMHPGLLVALVHTGNHVNAARVDGRLVGAAAGFFHEPAHPALHSHIAGVLPEFGGRGIGRALKYHQAAWCLERGIPEITWTFDPLVARNAHFNLTGLRTGVVEYLQDLYGTMNDGLNAGHPTDRLMVSWDLTSIGSPDAPAVWPPPEPGGVLLGADGPDGGPRFHRDATPGHRQGLGWCSVAVPSDIEALRIARPRLALEWRFAVRAALEPLLASDWVVTGFDPTTGYHLERNPDAAA
ncbi:MAG TPA: GNAT family N-acetyltransferase [Propionicimonas sp.]|jgi:predicted GNAT superfamily acetyltransferase|nr:GNAT family N-acetyltransferase [Propionicimonas sp.]